MSRSVTPYLVVDGGHEAIDWYRAVFGADGHVWLITRSPPG
jgi:uncharacterized glyoxalase superfamily protein PhnB